MSKMFHPGVFDLTRVPKHSSKSKSIQPAENKHSSERSYALETSDVETSSSGMDFFDVLYNEASFAFSTSEPQICQQPQLFEEFGSLDGLHHGTVSPSKSWEDDGKKIDEIECQNTDLLGPKNKQSYVLPAASFEVLRKHGSRRLKFDGKISGTGNDIQSTNAVLSTEMIIHLAAENFIQSMLESNNKLLVLSHPYLSSVLCRSEEDSKGVQLVQNLLLCAEKVGEKQHERALKFLKGCEKLSSPTGTPIQRLVFYFSEALFEKIAWETGRIVPKDLEKPLDPLAPVICPNLMIAFHKEHPHAQMTKFSGIQAIVDHLEEARKVHVIDLQVRSGVQWIILMQALAARTEHPIQYFKLTVVGTKAKSALEDTGRQLADFAESLDLKFIFKLVMVENILDLREDHFARDADEVVTVYAAYILTSLIGRIERINHVMEVIRIISPRVIVVTEVEANFNVPTFIGRFVESLFFFGAYFDSLADCFKNDETNRRSAETTLFRWSIRNVLAAEGEERNVRHVNINVWRAFFARFALGEVELSLSALDQARMVLQDFPCRSSCTLHMDGKCLIIGWKGTPLNSLSVWKFK